MGFSLATIALIDGFAGNHRKGLFLLIFVIAAGECNEVYKSFIAVFVGFLCEQNVEVSIKENVKLDFILFGNASFFRPIR